MIERNLHNLPKLLLGIFLILLAWLGGYLMMPNNAAEPRSEGGPYQ